MTARLRLAPTALPMFATAWLLMAIVTGGAEEPKANFEVHDVSLWILEPGSQQANLRTAYPSALPASITSGRGVPSVNTVNGGNLAAVRRVALARMPMSSPYSPPAANGSRRSI